MNLEDFKEDLVKQDKGSPCYVNRDSDACFFVRRADGADYVKEIEEITQQLYGFDRANVDHNLVIAWWLSEYGCTGWENLYSAGENLEYSKVNARLTFHNPSYFLSLNPLLLQHARDYNNYLFDAANKEVEEIKKS